MTFASVIAGGERDFDFLFGEWIVQGRRRRSAPGADGDAWETIEAVQKCWPLLHGLGNVGELVSDAGEPLYACLRFFDQKSGLWTIYSVSLIEGIRQPPVRGGFAAGTGEFRGEDTVDGRPIVLRDRWTGTESQRPRWERALSTDGGRSFEPCWIMEHERVFWPVEAGPVPEWLPAPARAGA